MSAMSATSPASPASPANAASAKTTANAMNAANAASAPYLSGTEDDQPVQAADLEQRRVLVFVPEGFVDSEVACVLDVLGWTRYRPSVATIAVETVGMRREVHGAFGMRVLVDSLIDEADPSRFDALVVSGGFHNLGFDEAYDPRLEKLAQAFRERGCPIATMCVGVLPVADAGLLAGGRATTYALSSRHDNRGRLRERGCEALDEPVVEWDGILSCAGPAYGEQVAYRLLEMLAGPQALAEVRRYRNGVSAG